MKTFTVAVVGATGAVGQTMLAILQERRFPVGTLHVLASERSAGEQIEYDGRKTTVQDLSGFDPSGVDFALFSAGGGKVRSAAESAGTSICRSIRSSNGPEIFP